MRGNLDFRPDVRCCLSCERTVGDQQMYTLQIVHRTYTKVLDVRYFLEYPLDNTLMYEATFGSLCKGVERMPLGWTSATFLGL